MGERDWGVHLDWGFVWGCIPVNAQGAQWDWFLIAFITWNSNLVPLLEGLAYVAQIHVDLSSQFFAFLPESNRRPRDVGASLWMHRETSGIVLFLEMNQESSGIVWVFVCVYEGYRRVQAWLRARVPYVLYSIFYILHSVSTMMLCILTSFCIFSFYFLFSIFYIAKLFRRDYLDYFKRWWFSWDMPVLTPVAGLFFWGFVWKDFKHEEIFKISFVFQMMLE